VPAPARVGPTIALEGPSGVGKSTIAAALARRLDAELLNEAYDLIEPLPSLSFSGPAELERLERTLLGIEAERFVRSERARREGRTVVLDTGVFGPLTYTSGLARIDPRYSGVLRRLAELARRRVRAGSLGLPSVTLYLDLGEPALARRLAGSPRTHPAVWQERHRAVGRWERRLWTWVYPRIAPGHLAVVRAGGSPSQVLDRLELRLSRMGSAGAVRAATALRTVRAFAVRPEPDRETRRPDLATGNR